MHRSKISIVAAACCLLTFSSTAFGADATKLSSKTPSPVSKIKTPAGIALPSSAPALPIEKTKSAPDTAPKPAVSIPTTPKPTLTTPAPRQIKTLPAPAKAPEPAVSLPQAVPMVPAASLPPAVPSNKLPGLQNRPLPGSAGRDLSRTNSIGNQVPGGMATGGLSSRGSGAGLATGVGGRGSVGKFDRSAISAPLIKTGSGTQRQGNDQPDDLGSYSDMDHMPDDINSKPSDTEITFTEEEAAADYHLDKADDAAGHALLLADEFKDIPDDEENQPPPEIDTSEEKLADDGPGDGNLNGNNVDPGKVKRIFEIAGGGVRFVDSEEPSTGGTVNPELLETIRANQTQVNTPDGLDLRSDNFEDLSKRAQQAVEDGLPGNPVSD